jgi:hypothetical protein
MYSRTQVAEDAPLPNAPLERMSQAQLDDWASTQPAPTPEEPPQEVPWAISNADLRRSLIERGINPASVLAWLNGLPDGPEKWAALNDWEYSNYYERAHPMLNDPDTLSLFGLAAADVDAMFLSKPAYPAQ